MNAEKRKVFQKSNSILYLVFCLRKIPRFTYCCIFSPVSLGTDCVGTQILYGQLLDCLCYPVVWQSAVRGIIQGITHSLVLE